MKCIKLFFWLHKDKKRCYTMKFLSSTVWLSAVNSSTTSAFQCAQTFRPLEYFMQQRDNNLIVAADS